MKSKKNRISKFLITSLILIISVAIVFFATYYTFMKKSYESFNNTMKDYVVKIDSINSDISLYSKNNTIDEYKIINDFPNIIDNLKNLKSELFNINPPSNLNENYNYLLKGLDNNIKIYMQVLTIVQRPKSTDIKNSILDLKDYRDTCRNYYSLIDTEFFKADLSSSFINFIDDVIYFANENIKTRKTEEIIHKQNIEFLDTMDIISKSFVDIKNKRDYKQCIIQSRTKNPNYDDIILSIEDDLKILNELRLQNKDIVPPTAGIKVHDKFSSLIKDYISYLSKLHHAIETEKIQSLTGNLDDNILNELYAPSTELINTVDSKHDEYKKLLSDLKTKELLH